MCATLLPTCLQDATEADGVLLGEADAHFKVSSSDRQAAGALAKRLDGDWSSIADCWSQLAEQDGSGSSSLAAMQPLRYQVQRHATALFGHLGIVAAGEVPTLTPMTGTSENDWIEGVKTAAAALQNGTNLSIRLNQRIVTLATTP